MSIRQVDTWVLSGYVDEAGWDGQNSYLYFSTQRDALEMGARIEALIDARGVSDQHFDWTVYKAERYPSFHKDRAGLEKAAENIVDEWLPD